MNFSDKIYVAGHNGLVGSAIVRELKRQGYNNIIVKSKQELDLRHSDSVFEFFNENKPDYVFLAAAKVGGIKANTDFPADFLLDNLQIQNNVMSWSAFYNVKKLLFLGSSCIYPKYATQPISEKELLNGYLESTNEGYAIAKIAGLKLCEYFNQQYMTNFISCMPTNLYGPNDNFNLNNSHVIPSLIRKFIESKDEVICWGNGSPLREFLYVDDLAEACIFLINNYNESTPINVGSGEEFTIKQLTEIIAEYTDFKGKIIWDETKPNGTPRKLLNTEKLDKLGWKAKTSLSKGLIKTIIWYLKNDYNKKL